MRAQVKKSDTIHPLKEGREEDRRSSEEGFYSEEMLNLGKPVIEEENVGEFLHEEWITLSETSRDKDGTKFKLFSGSQEASTIADNLNDHLRAKKTEVRILLNVFWPGLHHDVIRFGRFCDVCQKTVKKVMSRKYH